jgi:secondary thiamine-phosphate synthase enzyme
MRTEEITLETGSRLVSDVTEEVAAFVGKEQDGLVNVFVPHATAGVALIETGSGSEADLADAIDRVLPKDDVYRHRHGSRGHGRDHVLPALISPSLTLPVLGGRVTLGTWQSIVVVDPNVDNPTRTMRLTFIPG